MPNILYFIGAGVTKSLALPTRPVPAIFDFVSTAAEYLYDDIVLTTLAELENSEPYPYVWESPVARSLARQLVGRNRKTDPEARSQFARALRDRPGESIEDLLDRTGSASSNMSSQSADVRFRYAIRRLFTLIGWDVDWSPLISFLSGQFKARNTSHTFVSFNYDLILDRAIQLCINNNLALSRVYGFDISLQVTGEPPMNANGAFAAPQAFPLPGFAPEVDVCILKPHGSLNWLAPITEEVSSLSATNPLSQGRSVILLLTEDGSLRYLSSTETFQKVQPPNELPIAFEPVILTPRSAKKPDRQFLLDVREKEEDAIISAHEVYVLGWSIPRTDNDQECLIRNSVSKRTTPFQQVTAVNFFAGVDYFRRVEDIFGIDRTALRIFNSGYTEFAASR